MAKRVTYPRTGKTTQILNEVAIRTGIDRRIVTACLRGFFSAMREIIVAREAIRIAGFFTIRLRFSERMKDLRKQMGLEKPKRKKKTNYDRFVEYYTKNPTTPPYTLGKKFKLKTSTVIQYIEILTREERLSKKNNTKSANVHNNGEEETCKEVHEL